MTDIEDRQLKLLDYPASKQFLLCIVGSLREEIAGRKIVNPQSFELKPTFITSAPQTVVDAWKACLQAILPQMIQNLPAIEYQVVRSTEHTNAVSKTTKGIVAGVPLLQTSLEPRTSNLGATRQDLPTDCTQPCLPGLKSWSAHPTPKPK
jgi:hypothetical protein